MTSVDIAQIRNLLVIWIRKFIYVTVLSNIGLRISLMCFGSVFGFWFEKVT